MKALQFVILTTMFGLSIASHAAFVSYSGNSSSVTGSLATLMGQNMSVIGEFEIDVANGGSTTDPGDLLSVNLAFFSEFGGGGFCFSSEYPSSFCEGLDITGPFPIVDVSEFTLSLDASGLPVDGLIRLQGYARSPWPTFMEFDFTTGSFYWETIVGDATGSGHFYQPVPLPAAFLMLCSALGLLGAFKSRVK